MDYVKIETYQNTIEEGFQVSHPSKLPKKALHHKHFYDKDLNMCSMYIHITPKQTKWYIWVHPNIINQSDIDNLPPSKYSGK